MFTVNFENPTSSLITPIRSSSDLKKRPRLSFSESEFMIIGKALRSEYFLGYLNGAQYEPNSSLSR